MTTKIAPDETIATVWPKLAHPQDYIAGVSQRLYNCQKKNGNAAVSVGVTGKGVKPCYRITFTNGSANQVFGSWWDNHDALPVKDAETANWSARSMTFDQVGAFMQRHFKPPALKR